MLSFFCLFECRS